MASSTMWTLYSMLNSVLKGKYNFAMTNYPRITTLLKSYDVDMKKKARVFSKEEFDNFVGNADLTTPYWLVQKVVMIVCYFGGLRHTEADGLQVENFEVTADGDVVAHSWAKVSQ